MRIPILNSTLAIPAAAVAALLLLLMFNYGPATAPSTVDSEMFTRYQDDWARQVAAQPPPFVIEGSLSDHARLEQLTKADPNFLKDLESVVIRQGAASEMSSPPLNAIACRDASAAHIIATDLQRQSSISTDELITRNQVGGHCGVARLPDDFRSPTAIAREGVEIDAGGAAEDGRRTLVYELPAGHARNHEGSAVFFVLVPDPESVVASQPAAHQPRVFHLSDLATDSTANDEEFRDWQAKTFVSVDGEHDENDGLSSLGTSSGTGGQK